MLMILLLPLALAACGDSATTPMPDTTEVWIVDGVTYTSEPEAYDALEAAQLETVLRRADPENWLGGEQRDEYDAGGCQHWTFDQGTWWVRNCGYTLSEQCMYFSGPHGEVRSCDEVGGGPGGNW